MPPSKLEAVQIRIAQCHDALDSFGADVSSSVDYSSRLSLAASKDVRLHHPVPGCDSKMTPAIKHRFILDLLVVKRLIVYLFASTRPSDGLYINSNRLNFVCIFTAVFPFARLSLSSVIRPFLLIVEASNTPMTQNPRFNHLHY